MKDGKYIRPEFDERLSAYGADLRDKVFAKSLVTIVKRCQDNMAKAAIEEVEILFDNVKRACSVNYAAEKLDLPERRVSIDVLREESETRLSCCYDKEKAKAFKDIDDVVSRRVESVNGLRRAKQHSFSSVKDNEEFMSIQIMRNRDITVDELSSYWNSKQWVSYEFLNTLRFVAEERGFDWCPKHFLDDTAELTKAVGMCAKRIIKEIKANSDIESAIEFVTNAALTGYDHEGNVLIKFKKNGKPAFFDYQEG